MRPAVSANKRPDPSKRCQLSMRTAKPTGPLLNMASFLFGCFEGMPLNMASFVFGCFEGMPLSCKLYRLGVKGSGTCHSGYWRMSSPVPVGRCRRFRPSKAEELFPSKVPRLLIGELCSADFVDPSYGLMGFVFALGSCNCERSFG